MPGPWVKPSSSQDGLVLTPQTIGNPDEMPGEPSQEHALANGHGLDHREDR